MVAFGRIFEVGMEVYTSYLVRNSKNINILVATRCCYLPLGHRYSLCKLLLFARVAKTRGDG